MDCSLVIFYSTRLVSRFSFSSTMITGMIDLIRKLIPCSVRTGIRKLYSRIFKRHRLQASVYRALPALKCCIAYNKYGGYCVPESSRNRRAASKVLEGGVYEPEMLEFIAAHCGQGDIVHAGTYFGDFLPAMSAACGDSASIWAFEPNPENFRCACITCMLNGLENVNIENAGLGDAPDTMLVRTADEHGKSLGGGSEIVVADVGEAGGRFEKVKIVTIDDSIPADRDISIIQLDVEGYEQQALTGALKLIRRCKPIIILEVLPGSNLLASEWFSENITSIGYRYLESRHGNDILVCEAEEGKK